MGPMGAATPQLPLLRATADLLMMPKELLAEPAIRRDISQALSIRLAPICSQGLKRFQDLSSTHSAFPCK